MPTADERQRVRDRAADGIAGVHEVKPGKNTVGWPGKVVGLGLDANERRRLYRKGVRVLKEKNT